VTYFVFNTSHFKHKKHTKKGKGKGMIMLWLRQLVTGSCGICHKKLEATERRVCSYFILLRIVSLPLVFYTTFICHQLTAFWWKGNKLC